MNGLPKEKIYIFTELGDRTRAGKEIRKGGCPPSLITAIHLHSKGPQRFRERPSKGLERQARDWREAGVPNSLSLASVTLGKALALSGS